MSCGTFSSSFNRLTTPLILKHIYIPDRLPNMVWSCEAGHRESFGSISDRINKVRIGKGLQYMYSMIVTIMPPLIQCSNDVCAVVV